MKDCRQLACVQWGTSKIRTRCSLFGVSNMRIPLQTIGKILYHRLCLYDNINLYFMIQYNTVHNWVVMKL